MNIEQLDLNLLLAFRALLAERSVTRAALRVRITQPAMSNALSRLRVALGDPLFVRGPHGMTPTPRSMEIAPAIEAALHTLATIFPDGGFDPAAATNRFTIVCPDDVEVLIVPQLLTALERRAPRVTLAMRRPGSLFVLPQAELESGAADFAIGPYADPTPQSRLYVRLLNEGRFCAVMSSRRSHPPRLTLKAFAAMRHIGVYYPGEGPGLVDRMLAQQGLTRNVAVVAPHFLTATHYAAASDAVAVVPEALAKYYASMLPIRVAGVPLPLPPYRVQMVWHVRTLESPAHRWFRELVVDALGLAPAAKQAQNRHTRAQKRK